MRLSFLIIAGMILALDSRAVQNQMKKNGHKTIISKLKITSEIPGCRLKGKTGINPAIKYAGPQDNIPETLCY